MTLRAEKDRGGRPRVEDLPTPSRDPTRRHPTGMGHLSQRVLAAPTPAGGKGREARALCKRQELTWTIRPTPVPSVPPSTHNLAVSAEII